jgi:hypothetical protein
MKKIKKAKKAKKIKTKKLVAVVPKKKRGRPRKEKVAVAPKKRGRPRKVEKAGKGTKKEKLHKIAKLGKRKYKKAVEEMAMTKIGKKMRRKNSIGNGASHGDTVSSRDGINYSKYSPIAAGPNQLPVGVNSSSDKKDAIAKTPVRPILDRIKNRLIEKGYKWKESTFKVVEKTATMWAVEFVDKKQGEITSFAKVDDLKKAQEIEERIANGQATKPPKLSKIELNRYVKKLVERGLHPTNIKVIENTPEYFKIEFNDGNNGSVVTCGHVKTWDL